MDKVGGGGYVKYPRLYTRGGEGVKIGQNLVHIVVECPLMKNALNNQVGVLGDMFLWLVANLKQGVIYFIKQACGNDILASV